MIKYKTSYMKATFRTDSKPWKTLVFYKILNKSSK